MGVREEAQNVTRGGSLKRGKNFPLKGNFGAPKNKGFSPRGKKSSHTVKEKPRD